MSEQTRARPFAAAEAGARHLILMAGMGFLGLVVGAVITSSLLARLADRVDLEEGGVLTVVLALVLPNLWALAVIPGLAWVMLRFLEFNPVSFAVVSMGTAFLFRTALDIVSSGTEGLFADPGQLLFRLVILAAGIALTYVAGRRGQRHQQAQAAVAAAQAEKAKTQYAQFAEQARAMAERREANPIAPQQQQVDPTASSGPSAAAPAEPSPAPPAASEPSADPTGKT